MLFKVYNLLNRENTVKVLKELQKTVKGEGFSFHNLVRTRENDKLFKFNIVLNKENDNILSKEIWYKIQNAYVSLENFVLFVGFQEENISNIEVFENSFKGHFNLDIEKYNIQSTDFVKRLVEEEYSLNNLKFKENDGIDTSYDYNKILHKVDDIEVLELTAFNQTNDVFYFNNNSIFNCGNEFNLYKHIHIFKPTL